MENITVLVTWIACSLICFAIAKEKGKNIYVAIAIGLLFGLLGVLGYLLAKGSKEYQVKKAEEKVLKLKR